MGFVAILLCFLLLILFIIIIVSACVYIKNKTMAIMDLSCWMNHRDDYTYPPPPSSSPPQYSESFAASTAPIDKKWDDLIKRLTDWSLNYNRLVSIYKVVPTFELTKAREYIDNLVHKPLPRKDGMDRLRDVAKDLNNITHRGKKSPTEKFDQTNPVDSQLLSSLHRICDDILV